MTQKGKITAKKAGKAKVAVKAANGRKFTLNVYVLEKATPVKSVSIIGAPKNKTMKVGTYKILKAKISPAAATGKTGAVISWKSSNKKVMSVDAAGRITALKKGTAKVTASVGGKKVNVTVTVR